MDHCRKETRPDVDPAMAGVEFVRWYWPVHLLRQFCEELGLPSHGTKRELRQRVANELDAPEAIGDQVDPTPPKSTFKWSSQNLTAQTLITDNVSFGPNFRKFFQRHIGDNFVCHSDFMEWVKNNIGATLQDAVEAWWVLESRKDSPDFRREIAESNNFLQYLRDCKDENPEITHSDAKRCWDAKKMRPAHHGRVVYEQDDLRFLD
ncbi:MAG: DUF6434 domain-containing protein [Planctomycetota bacterium]